VIKRSRTNIGSLDHVGVALVAQCDLKKPGEETEEGQQGHEPTGHDARDRHRAVLPGGTNPDDAHDQGPDAHCDARQACDQVARVHRKIQDQGHQTQNHRRESHAFLFHVIPQSVVFRQVEHPDKAKGVPHTATTVVVVVQACENPAQTRLGHRHKIARRTDG